ncbi:MAG: hypothetical protein J2P45_20240 [Candidatus Dormibacteraeota bacterium]|nr:hypothetical protein [Candidatus Dormibacteraeota bacterium]
MDGLYHLTRPEWERRLSVLEEFCSSLGEDPDRVISASRADREAKLEYMRKLKHLTLERHPDPRTAHEAENLVRSFFIHNGARVMTRPFEHPPLPHPPPGGGETRGMARGTRPRLD